ncbi:right-handed parallel beta-helix repeat-containing protein [bacterium]|nr:right-handed parallel beta-helix repeat-containing protein [bacterium]
MKSRILGSLVLICIVMCTAICSAVVRNVPADYPTIQAGIDAAIEGDTVLLADGTYTGDGNRDIDFWGKAITVKSENGAKDCIVDCEGTESEPHRGFHFHSGEDVNSCLDGISIINGYITISSSGMSGGAILCSNFSSPRIINCIVSNNTAEDYNGGGIGCEDSSSPRIQNCTITHNRALGSSVYGGGILCWNNSSPIISFCYFFGNTSDDSCGALASFRSSPIIWSCEFIGNSAYTVGGLGLYYESYPIIFDCLIAYNSAHMTGGVRCSISSAQFLYCEISNNFSERTMSPGGILINTSSNAELINCTISQNVNGGIAIANSNPMISSCLIKGNSGEDLGGIYCSSHSSAEFINCLITENSCIEPGGGINIHNADATVVNCTISENTSEESGGGIRAVYANVSVLNSILWQNESPVGSEITVEDHNYPSVLTISYSDVDGGEEGIFVDQYCTLIWGNGMLDEDPLFVTDVGGEYYLSQTASGQTEDSPCVDSGSCLSENVCIETIENLLCLDEMWTRTDQISDSGQIDLGAHYPISTSNPCNHRGDVDFNGEITASDAQITFEIALSAYFPNYQEICAADCNGNTKITTEDAQSIFMAMLGLGVCIDPL